MILDGYIRVSQVAGRRGDGFISPSVQREQIEAWTSSNGALLGEVFEELDESGGRADRPLLMEAIERVESGESEGVIVAKLDRFGRSLLDGLGAIARIEEAGGTFVSVQDGFDLSTSTGKLVLRIMFSIGEWELERVRINWDIARGRAVARGLYIFRTAPVGYRRGKDRRLRIDPKAAAVVKGVFEQRLRGQTLERITEFLNNSELSTETGVPFSVSHVQYMIKTRAYRGEVHCGGHRKLSAHEPIVDAATWDACQSPSRPPRRRVEALLKERVRCANCGRLMRPVRRANGNQCYSCPGVRGKCTAPAHIRTDLIDPLVEDMMLGMWQRARSSEHNLEAEGCEEALASAEANLAVYRDNSKLQRRLGENGFEAGVASRQRTVEHKLLEVSEARRAVRRARFDVSNLEARWPGLSWDERRSALGEFIDCIIVARGKNSITERVWVFERGRGPIPRRPFERVEPLWALVENAIPLPGIKRWPRERLERELLAFLATRTQWPGYGEFAEAGQALLRAQVMAWGGPYYWGNELGVQVPIGMVYWNETVVRDAVAPLLAGRGKWPEAEEFRASGMTALYDAIKSHGGPAHWAGEFGVEYHPSGRRLWRKERVERELVAFVGERTTFPVQAEFELAGRSDLRYAAMRHGGIVYWCKQLGLKRSAGWLDQIQLGRKA